MQNLSWICTNGGCDPFTTLMLVFVAAFPFLLGATVVSIVVISIVRIITAKQPHQTKVHKKRLILLVMLVVSVFVFGVVVTQFDSYKRRQAIKNRNYNVYSLSGQKLYLNNLASPGPGYVPRVQSKLKTNIGEIDIVQVEYDEMFRERLKFPQNCDFIALSDYMSVGMLRSSYELKEEGCLTLFNSDGKSVYTANDTGWMKYDLPHIGVIDNTALLFTASTFRGSSEDMKMHVIDFMQNATVADDERLFSNYH